VNERQPPLPERPRPVVRRTAANRNAPAMPGLEPIDSTGYGYGGGGGGGGGDDKDGNENASFFAELNASVVPFAELEAMGCRDLLTVR